MSQSDTALLISSVLDMTPIHFPRLCVSLPVCNGLLRFTSDATPADVLVASMATELFSLTYLHMYKHWWGWSPGISCVKFSLKCSYLVVVKTFLFMNYSKHIQNDSWTRKHLKHVKPVQPSLLLLKSTREYV